MDYKTFPTEAEGLPIGPGRPSYYGVISAYLRRFADSPTDSGDELMPGDKRLIQAINAVYERANERDRRIMRGMFENEAPNAEERYRRSGIIYQVAQAAGLTHCYVFCDEERTKADEKDKIEAVDGKEH